MRSLTAVTLLALLSLCVGCLGRAQPSPVMKWCEMHNQLVLVNEGHHHHGQQRLGVELSQPQAPAAVRIWFENDLKGAKVDAVVSTNTGIVKMLDERRIAGRLIEVKLPQFSTAQALTITIHKHLRKAAVPKSLEFGFSDLNAPCEP